MAPLSVYALAVLVASVAAVTDRSCNCFISNHTTVHGLAETNRWQSHEFLDFTRVYGDKVSDSFRVPPLVRSANGDPNKTTDDFFNMSDFSVGWSFAAGSVDNPYNDNGQQSLLNTAQNAYIRKVDGNVTALTLRTSLMPSKDVNYRDVMPRADENYVLSGAALVSKTEVLYSTFRMRARFNSSIEGSIGGMYIHRDSGNGSALEAVPHDTINYATASLQMQPRNVTKAKMPNGADGKPTSWEDWHTYRLDWTADSMSAWIDDQLVAVRDASTTGIPSDPTPLQVAFGSDEGEIAQGRFNYNTWSTMDVQWIELAYNTSVPASTADCSDKTEFFCTLEGERAPGNPLMGGDPTSVASGLRIGCVWMAAAVMAVMVLL